MTSPAFLCTARLAPTALTALLLAACGDSGGTTATDSSNGTSDTSNSSPTSDQPTTTSASSVSMSASDTGTTAGSASMSASDTGTTVGTAETTADTSATMTSVSTDTSTTSPETTNPVDTTAESSSTTNVDPDTGTSSTGTTAGDESTSTGDDTTGSPVVPCGCPDDIEVPLDDGIFVLRDNPPQLWKFFPETNEFQMLGALNCGGMQQAFSMAVDRLGFAWVMFNPVAGDIWKVDVTNTANCMDPGYNPGQQGVNLFGMAFVSNSAVDVCDSLYGNTYNGIGGFSEGNMIGDFINVDPDTLLLTKKSKTNFNGAEVSGSGDGRTFLFGGVNPSKLVEVDKTTGTIISTLPLPGLELTNAFAFAFFGGDFYLFTESNNNTLFSKVTHLDYDDSNMNGQQELTTVVAQGPIRIVGAGVSTCAPFEPQ
ncbi:MAG: hypothetical protein JNL82_07255 [Myxococcales bacterium]|nr:hypothetical protein [Myxococcales bacterium]